MKVERVLLAEPRGFCAGVEMAIKALAWMVRIFEPPVYCYHEIVHNRLVVEAFAAQGVIFVDDVEDVPAGAPLMLSAHGSAPEVELAAAGSHRTVVNAVCPLVTKVHHELKVRANKGYTVVYVGHAGHEEAIGTMAVAPSAVRLVESEADVDALEDPGTPVALLAQTTLPHDEWSGIAERARQRFPELWMPGRSDLCYATTNRQGALRAIAGKCDAVVVIGSANSSNTVSLTHVAHATGCAHVIRVNSADELPDDLTGVVGVTAGASAPEWLVDEVLARLAPANGVEIVTTVEEQEYFPPPPELRELLRSVATAAAITLGTPPVGPLPSAEDRTVPRGDDARGSHRVNSRELERRRALDTLVDDVAIEGLIEAQGSPELAPVAVVIASYKERENIGAVVTAIPTRICGLDVSVIVVIDGEEDGSAEIVRTAGHYAVVAPVNRGQGAALRLGYRVARTFGAEFIVTADADGQTDPADLAIVLGPVVDGSADFVNGSRRLGTTHSNGVVRNTGVYLFGKVITALTGTVVTDTANPIRAMRAELTAKLILDEPQYQASELLIGAVMSGARFLERPVTMYARTSGRSKKGGNLTYGYRYGKVFLKTWWRELRRKR